MTMEEFDQLIDEYFGIGVKEGRERRNHDDLAGSAEDTRQKIRAAFQGCSLIPASPQVSDQIDRMRERAERAEAERDALKQAVAPFCNETIKTWVDEHGWTAVAPSRDRICDWFGPSDFRTLLTKLQDTSHE